MASRRHHASDASWAEPPLPEVDDRGMEVLPPRRQHAAEGRHLRVTAEEFGEAHLLQRGGRRLARGLLIPALCQRVRPVPFPAVRW